MGFDQDQGPEQPIIRPRKPDTKINIWMSILILIFLLFGGWLLLRIKDEPPQSEQAVSSPEIP